MEIQAVIRWTRRPKSMIFLLFLSMASTFLCLLYTDTLGIGSFTVFSVSRYFCVDNEAKFSSEVIRLLQACSTVAPLIIIDPDWLNCIQMGNCSWCSPSTIRFAVINDQLNISYGELKKNLLEATKDSWWHLDQSMQKSGALHFTNDYSFINIFISVLKIKQNYWYLYDTGDGHPRAFFGLNLTELNIYKENDHQLYIPNPIDLYLWEWPRSIFIECNVTSAQYLLKHNPEIYNKKPIVPASFVGILAYVRDIFSKFRITVFLAGGTALGWYRECKIIPHTKDTDLGFLTWEWKPEIEDILKNDSILKHRISYGALATGFEMVFRPWNYRMDVFGIYDRGGNETWIGHRTLKWIYPKLDNRTDICTGDLNGQLFFVRCDIVTALEIEYGPKWYLHHHTKNYTWHKSHFNIEGRRTG